jgi:hypothetical protein
LSRESFCQAASFFDLNPVAVIANLLGVCVKLKQLVKLKVEGYGRREMWRCEEQKRAASMSRPRDVRGILVLRQCGLVLGGLAATASSGASTASSAAATASATAA